MQLGYDSQGRWVGDAVNRLVESTDKDFQRGRTMRGEELREFLKSINRLGFPPRPPPVPLAGRDWPQESLEDPFIGPDSSHSAPGGYQGLECQPG